MLIVPNLRAHVVPSKRPNPGTPALEKGLDIIELLASRPAGLTLSQLARELNRTVSEIYRMLVCLESKGYVRQYEGDRYGLTLKLFRIAHEHPLAERLLARSVLVMQRLSKATQQSCHLSVLEAGKMIVLGRVSSPIHPSFNMRVGARMDLLESSGGYAILAHQQIELREQTLAQWQRSVKLSLPQGIRQRLRRVRECGFDRWPNHPIRRVLSISVPIVDQWNTVFAALTLTQIRQCQVSMPERTTIEAVIRARDEIARSVGGVEGAHRTSRFCDS
jgi:DNA-binding IclR family transcriptional regulator